MALNAFGRSQIVLDAANNAFVMLPFGRIVSASAASGWTDWTVQFDGSGLNAFGEVVVDRDRVASDGVFIFVTESGVIKLLDFGIAKVLKPLEAQGGSPVPGVAGSSQMLISSSQLTTAGAIVGTQSHMSPEQWGIGIEVDRLTDLWACGILMFQMICGRHPLHPLVGNQLMVTAWLDAPMPSMTAFAPQDVPRGLTEVVDRCLQKRKEQRWQNAAELLAALVPFLPDRDAHGAGVPLRDVDRCSCRRRR